ncbi:MAG: hypothetical protein KDA59_04100, partial [Planctomycetales bacterium]|nr:hypothetical protein [Planctomycetales bacterium]
MVELLVVVCVIAVIIGLLLPAVQSARKAAIRSKLTSQGELDLYSGQTPERPASTPDPAAELPLARVQDFIAEVQLTPRLSVGTATPESIYEAEFVGKITAAQPDSDQVECELELPLPPQVISLADLSVQVDGKPSEAVAIRQGKLVWRGKLPSIMTAMEITYSAVGKGLYELSVPPSSILNEFDVSLIAKGSDLQLLELSLQPTSVDRSGGSSTYRWQYERLLFGQPVRLDVLGIAPIDRLGELTWLGPLSVVLFGLLTGLVVQAAAVKQFDRSMLLLTVGTFAGAYPLMYFAQEYVPLSVAVLVSASVV